MTADDHHDAMMESPSETLRRIFDGQSSALGSQMADESSRYDALTHASFPFPSRNGHA